MQTECSNRPRWIIVDDNLHFLSLMHAIIAEVVDADVQCFQSPHTALSAFEAAPKTVDFVITDLEMPGMNGIELGERLRKLSPALKILLVTGSGIFTNEEAAQKGFCGLLQKTFSDCGFAKRACGRGDSGNSGGRHIQKLSGPNSGLKCSVQIDAINISTRSEKILHRMMRMLRVV
jgi:CheY-like chemotaxis protein